MPRRDDDQQGKQTHAEGQQGEKTHAAFVERLHAKLPAEDPDVDANNSPDFDEFGRPTGGRHRLTEDRQQHDEAEKNSEANRLRG